jgi:hypothetical protein
MNATNDKSRQASQNNGGDVSRTYRLETESRGGIAGRGHTYKRLSLRLPLVFGGIGFALCALAFLAFGVYLDWDSPKLINFLAAWIPFVLSVLFAFVPSGKEMKREWIKWAWRGAVVVIGFFWSVMLWHQQDLSDQANSRQTQDAIGTAVSRANDHADKRFDQVQENVGGVQRQVTGLGQSLDNTTKALSSALEKSTTELSSDLGKVGKPDPPELAKLRFTLFRDDLLVQMEPLKEDTIRKDGDGSIQIPFTMRNISNVSADSIDIWVYICNTCEFAKEPDGFDKPEGLVKNARHRLISSLNAGVAMQKTSIAVKYDGPEKRVGIAFASSCKNCGPVQRTEDYLVDITPPTAPTAQ